MRKLGIAIYPEKMQMNDMQNYIKSAHKNNFKIVWTALLQISSNEINNNSKIIEKYKKILKFSREKNMINIIDVNKTILDAIAFDGDLKFFADMYIDVIRFDSPMSAINLANLTYNEYGIKIELNMDNNDYLLEETLHHGGIKDNILGSHNFYPQKYCGISKEFYTKTSKKYKANGIKTTSFISTKQNNRIANWKIDDFCCTLEEIRGLNIVSQANYLWSSNLTDNIIICNAYASEKELEILGKLNPYYVNLQIELTNKITSLEKKILLNEKHFRRADINPYFIRSTQSRVKFKNKDFPPLDNTIDYKPGNILIGNNNFDIYKGELQIVLKNSLNDERKNFVASIIDDDLLSLENINSYTKFRFFLSNEMY